MEVSKHTQEIIALGKKLVSEFSAHDRRDITLNWMAHHVSELIVSAEKEDDEFKKANLEIKACETILTIWQNRNDFPRGTRPLSGLLQAVEVIRSLRAHDAENDYWGRTRELQQNSAWGNFAESLRNSNETIYALTMYASIGSDVLNGEKEWSQFPNMLSEEEKELLEYIDDILMRDDNPIRIVYTSTEKKKKKTSKPEKLDRIFSKIDRLMKQQFEKFEALKADVLKGREIEEDDEWDDEFNDFLDDRDM